MISSCPKVVRRLSHLICDIRFQYRDEWGHCTKTGIAWGWKYSQNLGAHPYSPTYSTFNSIGGKISLRDFWKERSTKNIDRRGKINLCVFEVEGLVIWRRRTSWQMRKALKTTTFSLPQGEMRAWFSVKLCTAPSLSVVRSCEVGQMQKWVQLCGMEQSIQEYTVEEILLRSLGKICTISVIGKSPEDHYWW